MSTPIPTPTARMLDSLTPSDDGWTTTIGEDWLQGRSCFGGLQAALAVQAMRRLRPDAPALRTLQTTFIGPVPAGPLRIAAGVLRTGRSAMHVEARLFAGNELAALAIGVFGAARASAVSLAFPPPAVARTPAQSRELPFFPGISPGFMQHLRFRWAEGGFPFSGHECAKTQVYVEVRDEPRISEAHAILLADAIPSPALSLFRKPTPASSLTWALEILDDRLDVPAAPWLVDAAVESGRDGYLSQNAVLWSDDGRAICTSRQTVVVFG